ncbi:2',3'-cyclic-nucleotide 3'-phosphodiesterase-like [Liolophura sinensis]|uniref:2',3'-cyclic-nucleotide 3'-phosphodiesterase-like n=1 Tax=Liolophura sinensis TaxID=3198878 RepID=UPI003159181D
MVNKQTRKEKKKRKQQQRLKQKELLQKATDFPFIQNDKVVRYIQRSKVMFIMRGLAGAGKSTIVEILQKKYKNSEVCSADNFFSRNGSYEFDKNLLGEAHLNCHSLARVACENKKPVVVIDNTNVMRWEMKAYLELAVKHNYVVIMVTPKTSWRWNPEELARRNKHGVTVEILQKKVTMFQDTIPLYYGWFLNEGDSERLLEMRNWIYQICLQQCPAFREVLCRHTGLTEGEEEDMNSTLRDHFTRSGSAGILHCTSRFCRWGKEDGAKQYHDKKIVQSSCGKVFKLVVTGVTITPRTIAARVKLNQRQLKLWGNDAREKDFKNHFRRNEISTRIGELNQSAASLKQNKCDSAMCKSLSVSTNHTDVQVIDGHVSVVLRNSKRTSRSANKNAPGDALLTENPFSVLEQSDAVDPVESSPVVPSTNESVSKGSNPPPNVAQAVSAHVTLGFANGIRAQQSGIDILEIISIATRKGPAFMKRLDNAVLYYYGEGRCEVSFNKSLEYDSIFSGFY